MNAMGLFLLILLLALVIMVINGIHRRMKSKQTLANKEADELERMRKFIRLMKEAESHDHDKETPRVGKVVRRVR